MTTVRDQGSASAHIRAALMPFLLMSIGALSLCAFHLGVFLPLWTSVTVLLGISGFLYFEYKRRRIGLLVLLLWLVFALPFIHVVPYLWFDFQNADPLLLWGLVVNPYMLDARVIQLTAMLGAVGGVGFALGISLGKAPIAKDSTTNSAGQRTIKLLSLPIFLAWVISGVAMSWLMAPERTLFSATYTESASILADANFSSAWMISYALLAFAFCDAILDQTKERGLLKRQIVIAAIAFAVVYLQLLRGDRESLPFVFGLLLVYFYWASPFTQTRYARPHWVTIAVGALVLVVTSMLIGATRYSLAELRNPEQVLHLLADLYQSDVISPSNLLHGTWSAVLLTPLSVAGDYIHGLLQFRFGEDYLNLVLSIPPGFVADAFGYARPIDAMSGPAWEMRYGLGGTHATVLPFMNFGMFGVFFISTFWAYIVARYEVNALRKIGTCNLALLCILAMAAPHWLWYGEKNVINALIIWLLLTYFYRLSLSASRVSWSIRRSERSW